MKKRNVLQYPVDSAEFVVSHAVWQIKRGRNPSATFGEIRNPRLALMKAMATVITDELFSRSLESVAMDDDEVTCRKCGRTYVSSFMDDFYPDPGSDPETGLCERCAMAEAMAPKPIPSEEHLSKVCLMSRPGACMFLVSDGQPKCAKGSSVNNLIVDCHQAGELRATGNNCSGPTDFKPIVPQPA